MDDDQPALKTAARKAPEACPVRFELCDKLYERGAWERSMSCVDNVKDLSLLRCISHVDRLTVSADAVKDWRHIAALPELTELELRGSGSVLLGHVAEIDIEPEPRRSRRRARENELPTEVVVLIGLRKSDAS